jgi:hypothetical protein
MSFLSSAVHLISSNILYVPLNYVGKGGRASADFANIVSYDRVLCDPDPHFCRKF